MPAESGSIADVPANQDSLWIQTGYFSTETLYPAAIDKIQMDVCQPSNTFLISLHNCPITTT